jgi:anti-sigma factor RsiW
MFTPPGRAFTTAPCGAPRDRLLELLDGALDAGTARAFVAHLAGCASCRADLAHYRRLRALLARQATCAPSSLRGRVALELAAARCEPVRTLARAGG